jgi:hypothetical protein
MLGVAMARAKPAKAALKQKLTVSLETSVIRKAKIIAARQSTSVSELAARQIESLVDKDEQHGRAKRHALALLENGFHLGGKVRVRRDELHER